jgi:hypothetical protein
LYRHFHQTYARPIWALYERWEQYLNISDQVEKTTLQDFAESVVSHHPEAVHSLLWQIHNMVVVPWGGSSFHQSVFDHLTNLLSVSESFTIEHRHPWLESCEKI